MRLTFSLLGVTPDDFTYEGRVLSLNGLTKQSRPTHPNTSSDNVPNLVPRVFPLMEERGKTLGTRLQCALMCQLYHFGVLPINR